MQFGGEKNGTILAVWKVSVYRFTQNFPTQFWPLPLTKHLCVSSFLSKSHSSKEMWPWMMTKYKVGITGKNINLCCMNAERPSLCTENTCSVIS